MFTFPVTLFGGATATRVFESNATIGSGSGGLNSYSFSSQAIGTADPTRYVVVLVSAVNTLGTDTTISSVTFNGAAASILKQSAGGGGPIVISAMVGALITSGTTMNVVVNVSGASGRSCSIAIYSLYNLVSMTPFDIQSGSASPGTSVSCTANVPGGGIKLGVTTSPSNETQTWTNITKDGQQTQSLTNDTQSWSSNQFATAASTVTFTASGTFTVGRSMVVGTWQ